MDVNRAIETRQSIGRVKAGPGSKRALSEWILESAVHAPEPQNYRTVELPRLYRQGTRRVRPRPRGTRAHHGRGRGRRRRLRPPVESAASGKKAFRAPVVIAVISKAGRDEVETIENYAACAAAVQNMQANRPLFGPRLHLANRPPSPTTITCGSSSAWVKENRIVAYLYVGYPDMGERPAQARGR